MFLLIQVSTDVIANKKLPPITRPRHPSPYVVMRAAYILTSRSLRMWPPAPWHYSSKRACSPNPRPRSQIARPNTACTSIRTGWWTSLSFFSHTSSEPPTRAFNSPGSDGVIQGGQMKSQRTSGRRLNEVLTAPWCGLMIWIWNTPRHIRH